ncbi:MAG: hypothetical protein ACI97A_002745, partial [Planctomycetota bacterium]
MTMNNDQHHQDDLEFQGLLEKQHPVLTAILILLVTALAIWVIRKSDVPSKPDSFDDPTGKRDVIATLEAAAQDPSDRVILLLGDSVLRGNILRQNGFAEGKTVAHWARQMAPRQVAIYDLSLDGLLPCDIEAILWQLQNLDPAAKVEVAVELSPRFLSAQYAQEDKKHARDWFGELSQSANQNRVASTELTNHRLGLKSTRRRLGEILRHPEREILKGPKANRQDGDFLRVARHFLEPDLSANNVQERALRSIAASLSKHQRRTLFFNTPINGHAFGLDRHPQEIVESQLYCRQIVRPSALVDVNRPSFRFLFRHFDDAAFEASDFIDHCHLKPHANRRLASRILTSLAVPTTGHQVASQEGQINDQGNQPRDGFNDQGVILSSRRASFLNADHVLLTEDWNGREFLRLVDLKTPCVMTLDTSFFEGAKVAGLHEWGHNRAIILLSNGKILNYGLNQGFSDISPASAEASWHESDLIMARHQDLFVIYDAKSNITWSFDAEQGTLAKLFDVPEEMLIHSLAISEDATAFVLTELRDDNPNSTGMHSIPLAKFMVGDLSQLRTHFNDEKALAVNAWQEILSSFGLVQERPQKDKIPIAAASKIHILKPGHRVLVEAPTYTADYGPKPSRVRPVEDTTTLWNVDTRSNLAYAMLWPSAKGTVIDRRARLPIRPGRVHAVHAESGRVFSQWFGWRTFESSEVMRFNWKYGVPPDALSDSVTAMGFTRQKKSGPSWRVGFFGSSITGAIWPFDDISAGQLVTSTSIARGFGIAARLKRGDSPFAADGINMSMARCDLIGMYAVLLASDSTDLNAAVFCLDKATLGEPDQSKNDGGLTLVERWPTISRDENKRPIIDRVSGIFPEIRLSGQAPSKSSREAVIGAAMTEIVTYCRAQGITPLFLDLESVDRSVMNPEVIPTFGLPGDMEIARQVLDDLEVSLIDAKKLIGASLPHLHPYALEKDRHFRSHFLNAIGQ